MICGVPLHRLLWNQTPPSLLSSTWRVATTQVTSSTPQRSARSSRGAICLPRPRSSTGPEGASLAELYAALHGQEVDNGAGSRHIGQYL